MTSVKIPEDRFRTRVSDRLPWKRLRSHQSEQDKKKSGAALQHTHPIPFTACMHNRKRAPYTKEEGNIILNRVKNQLTLEQAERTRKRVEKLNSSGRAQSKASTNAQLSSPTSSSAEEGETLTEDLELPS